MTYQEALDLHLQDITNKSEELKSEIRDFVISNSDKENLEFLISEEFRHKMSEFNDKYNMSTPKVLVGTVFGHQAFVNSITVYLDLVKYPQTLLETQKKNTD